MAALFEKDQVGKREDLADLVAQVESHATPVGSLAKKGSKPGNSVMSWQATSLSAAQNSPIVDGTDVTSSDYEHNTRSLLQNYIQIVRRVVRVSPLSIDISNVAGVKDELAFQVANAILELKKDAELILCADAGAQADNGTVGYKTRGLHKWINTNANKDSTLAPDSAFTTPSASIETTATTANIDDTTVQDVLSSIFAQTGSIKEYDMPVGRTLKRAFTDRLTGVTTASDSTNQIAATQVRTFSPMNGKSVTYRVDIFNGDFGSVKLHPSNFLDAQTDGLVLDMSNVEIKYGKLPSVRTLNDQGGGPIRMIEMYQALCLHAGGLNHGRFDLAS